MYSIAVSTAEERGCAEPIMQRWIPEHKFEEYKTKNKHKIAKCQGTAIENRNKKRYVTKSAATACLRLQIKTTKPKTQQSAIP
jgi:hypothetical protein